MPNVEFADSAYAAADGADAVVLVTEWDVLRALDLRRLARSMAQPIFVDLRNVYPAADVEEAGLRGFWVGRG
jgi:UDPglucose 6-dehydrogenase